MTDVTPVDILNHIREPLLVTMIHDDSTVNAVGKSIPILIGDSEQITLLVYLTAMTGTASIKYNVNVIEEVSGEVIKTYAGTELSAAGADYILISNVTLGDYIEVSWSTTGTLDGSNYFTGCFVRLIAK